MARISNKEIYPEIDPVLDDYFVLTDANSNLATKTCTLRAMRDLFEQEYNSLSITVTAAQLKDLEANPVTLIPAPGANKVIHIYSLLFFLSAGSTPFNQVNPMRYTQGLNPTNGNLNVYSSISNTLMNGTADVCSTQSLAPEIVGVNSPTILQCNQNSGSDPTQGNGFVKIYLRYRILDLSTFN